MVEGYGAHVWEFDGYSLTGNPLTINAAYYTEGDYTVNFTGTRNGGSHTESVNFTVTYPPLGFGATVTDTSNYQLVSANGTNVALTANTGGQIGETDNYDPNVYFKVIKTSGQTIGVGGNDLAYVAIAAVGTTVDGSTPDDETAVITVRPRPVTGANGEMLDTQFDGGVYNFTLTSSGNDVNQITLTVEPHLTGTAVFLVNAKTAGDVAGLPAGTNVLTRLGGIKKAAVTGNSLADSASTVSATEAPSEGNHLLSALARVDRLAEAGNEYLIRVEHSEALPKVMLTCNYPATETDTVAVRLRGLDSGARTITYDDIGLGYSYPNGKTPATTASDFGRGIINIGDHRSDSTYTAYITLALENNITLAGKGSEYTDSANTTAMVQAGKHTTFIMRNGSKITGYYNINENTYNSVVLLLEDLSSEPGKEKGFKMQGGEITGNTTHIETGSVVTFHSDGQPSVGITHFTKTGGRIYDNTPNHFIASLILQQSKYAIPDGNTGTWPISQGDLVN